MIEAAESTDSRSSIPRWTFWLAYAGAVVTFGVLEIPVWMDPDLRDERLSGWLTGSEADGLPYVIALIAVPLLWKGLRDRKIRPRWQSAVRTALSNRPGDPLVIPSMMGILVFLIAFLASHLVGQQFDGLPPAYHDEYSYLFQAETYLAGRWSFPSFKPRPELFDQVHVLNEGRFASRYFPGVGAWIAPFLAMGDPWLGHRLAQALVAFLVFWVGRELSCAGVGVLAGLLIAVSPGLILFSNLLLSHHPTLVGLFLFLYFFLRWQRTGTRWQLLIAGIGLSYAMLCRPMTAAGFGLPFGIVFFYRTLMSRREDLQIRDRILNTIALGLPIACGFALTAYSNAQIAGSPLTSPYQLYTDIYTPRHVYGFNNVTRGEQQLGPKVLDNYDRWAENLTPTLAAKNVVTRLYFSFHWTLGVIPLAFGLTIFLLTVSRSDPRWRLILASVLTLHAVHIPYWFSGIMGWHYVFESAPLLILMFAESVQRMTVTSQITGSRFVFWTPVLLICTALGVNLLTVTPLWPGQLQRGITELQYPRSKYAAFRSQIEEMRNGDRAIVLVVPDPYDRHIDYVTNPPSLTGDVLVGRVSSDQEAEFAADLFPDRTAWVYDAQSNTFSRLD